MQGLYGRMRKNMKGRKGQQGFTLIELLVVVTILGVLAAIVTLSLVGLTTNATIQGCQQEYKTVQAALDAYMAARNVDTINGATDTNDMTTVLDSSGPPTSLFNQVSPGPGNPNFTRNGTTQYWYTWDTHGRITNIYKDGSLGAPPTGCTVK
jgi:prepilin-type N-terminal cleavage/methylation domain-containing protein